MLTLDGIEPAQTEWASPIFFVPNIDVTLRFFVNYRKLDMVKIRNLYLVPRMEECIDVLGDVMIFSTLDVDRRYRQVEIAEENRN